MSPIFIKLKFTLIAKCREQFSPRTNDAILDTRDLAETRLDGWETTPLR